MRKKRILVADDDAAILDMLMLFLEECGYEVETAMDGSNLQAFPQGLPDLMVLDVRMSGWSGDEICRHLKNQEDSKDLPILLISANREMKTVAREAGANDFVAKPFDLEDLLKVIEQHLPLAS